MLRIGLLFLVVLTAFARPALAAPGSPAFDQAVNYFNYGQYPAAADLFTRQLAADPQDALAHYYLGVSLHTIGRYAEATREYNWVLLNSQDSELIRRVQLGLQALARIGPTPGAAYAAAARPAVNTTASQMPPLAPAFNGRPQTGQPYNEQPHYAQPQAAASPSAAAPAEPVITPLVATAQSIKLPAKLPAASVGSTGSLRVVDCYTPWCGWCKKFEPLFKKAQAKYRGRITFERLDAEEKANRTFVNTYAVKAYPTILFFSADGTLVKRINGAPQRFEDFERTLLAAFPSVH